MIAREGLRTAGGSRPCHFAPSFQEINLILKPRLHYLIIACQDLCGGRCMRNGMNDSIDFTTPAATEERLNSPVAEHRTGGKMWLTITRDA